MKKYALFYAMLAMAALPAQSQLILQPGDAYTYEFSNLPFQTLVPPTMFPVGGRLELQNVVPVSFVAGDTVALHVDLFENALSESPVSSFIYPGTLPP